MNTYMVGQIIEFPVQFYDDTQPYGQPIDPSTVQFRFQSPTTPLVTYVYTSSVIASPGVVARLGTGAYQAQINTVGMTPDTFNYGWLGQGVGQTIGATQFILIASPVG